MARMARMARMASMFSATVRGCWRLTQVLELTHWGSRLQPSCAGESNGDGFCRRLLRGNTCENRRIFCLDSRLMFSIELCMTFYPNLCDLCIEKSRPSRTLAWASTTHLKTNMERLKTVFLNGFLLSSASILGHVQVHITQVPKSIHLDHLDQVPKKSSFWDVFSGKLKKKGQSHSRKQCPQLHPI